MTRWAIARPQRRQMGEERAAGTEPGLASPFAWRDAGGRYEDFLKRNPRQDTVTDLCDATQQLDLDMESYWKTREEKSRKRQERWARRSSAKNEIG